MPKCLFYVHANTPLQGYFIRFIVHPHQVKTGGQGDAVRRLTLADVFQRSGGRVYRYVGRLRAVDAERAVGGADAQGVVDRFDGGRGVFFNRDEAGGGEAAVAGGHGNGGSAGFQGFHFAVGVDGGDRRVAALPADRRVVGIPGADGSGKRKLPSYLERGRGAVEADAGDVVDGRGRRRIGGFRFRYCDSAGGSLAVVVYRGGGDGGGAFFNGCHFACGIDGGDRRVAAIPANRRVGCIGGRNRGCERLARPYLQREDRFIERQAGDGRPRRITEEERAQAAYFKLEAGREAAGDDRFRRPVAFQVEDAEECTVFGCSLRVWQGDGDRGSVEI